MQEEPREAERHSCKSEGGQQEQGSGERGHDSSEGVPHVAPRSDLFTGAKSTASVDLDIEKRRNAGG